MFCLVGGLLQNGSFHLTIGRSTGSSSKGTAEVTNRDKVSTLTENLSIYMLLGEARHIVFLGSIPPTIIKVQSGRFLSKNDTFRFEGVYGRT